LLPNFNSNVARWKRPGTLAFARADADNMPEQAAKYCGWDGKLTLVFIERGRPIEINGRLHVRRAKKIREAMAKVYAMATGESIKQSLG
jgi:hypothetical protein